MSSREQIADTEDQRRRWSVPRAGWLLQVTFLLIVVGAAVTTVWIPYQKNQRLIRQIAQAGGSFTAIPGEPEWLKDWVGESRFSVFEEIVAVNLDRTAVDDAWLRRFEDVRKIASLSLKGCRVSDAGIESLKSLKQLRSLSIEGTRVTDAGLAKLKSLQQLETLLLSGESISDAGLIHVQEMSQLKVLIVGPTRVSDAGIVGLKILPNLRVLTLYGGDAITEAGVEELRRSAPQLAIQRRGAACLGVSGSPHPQGCQIRVVQPGSAADRARIVRNDILLTFDGSPVPDFETLIKLMLSKKPHDKVSLELMRGETSLVTEVSLGEW